LTIRREIGHFDNITIGFCGDLKFGRTVHSLIKALSRYPGVKVVLIAPEQLRLPDYMKEEVCDRYGVDYREVDTMEEVMGELDVLYMTRVQKERFFDEDEYDRVKDFFILDSEKLKLARPEMRILHPLPRVNEITVDVDADPRAAYFRQVENGKFVRMALIVKLLEWAKDPSKTTKLVPDDAIRGKFICRNKRCISNMEVGVESLFRPAHDSSGGYRCVYCESKPK
ncbi:MAG: aspartate carbamoyltransferase, partial [Muribaculaceae bacterium]|nr:aspartate carbamoyltransferase [Muribaculaceae bacterium]